MTDQRDAWGERLPRRLGLPAFTGVIVGLTFGAGIFRSPASVAAVLDSPGLVVAVWCAGALLSIAGALTLAELGAALPRSGGYFVALQAAYGPSIAFAYGWAELTVITPSVLGAGGYVAAQYLGYFVPLEQSGTRVLAAVVVLVAVTLAYFGTRLAALVTGVSTVAKYAGLGLFIAMALLFGRGNTAHMTPLFPAESTAGVSAFVTALLAVMFAFDGWGDGLRVAGEVRHPARNVPLGMFLAVGLVGGIYVLANLMYLWLLPLSEIAASPVVAAAAAERIPVLGALGARLVAAMVVVSAFGLTVACAFAMPRTQFVMADRGLFFRSVGRMSPRFQSPSVATWTVGAVSIAYIYVGDFQRLADRMILGLWPMYLLCAAAVYVLRRTRPDLERPYRAWGYPVLPAIVIVAGLAMMVNALVQDPVNTGVTFGLLAAGVPIYWAWRALGGGKGDGTAPSAAAGPGA